MKYFGTVKSFDTIKGHGEIKQEAGGNDLRFETSAILWDKNSRRSSVSVSATMSARLPSAIPAR